LISESDMELSALATGYVGTRRSSVSKRFLFRRLLRLIRFDRLLRLSRRYGTSPPHHEHDRSSDECKRDNNHNDSG